MMVDASRYHVIWLERGELYMREFSLGCEEELEKVVTGLHDRSKIYDYCGEPIVVWGYLVEFEPVEIKTVYRKKLVGIKDPSGLLVVAGNVGI